MTTIKLDIQGVDPEADDLKHFHADWCKCTAEENMIVSGQRNRAQLSMAQRFVIDMFCGMEQETPETVGTVFPAQVELEALFRGRQRALAAAFHRGDVS